MSEPAYGIVKRVAVGYDEAVQLTREALKEQGFGVLTEIDVKATLKAKLDVDFRPYIILGACNPQLAYEALSSEPDVGLMLPCNVVVYEEGPGVTRVEAISPMTALGVVESAALEGIAGQAEVKLQAAMETVGERGGAV